MTVTDHRQAEAHGHTHGPGCGHYDECTTCNHTACSCANCSGDQCQNCVCADCSSATCKHAA